MKDHSYIAVCEAANIELAEAFIDVIKTLDAKVAKARLSAILNYQGDPSLSAIHVIGQFAALSNSETCVDRNG